MPKSKKPRHPHRTKVGTNFWNVRKENLDYIRSEFATLELKSMVNLEQGTCTDDDFYLFRDFINWGIVAACTRPGYDNESVDAACEALRQAAEALSIVQVRGRKNFCHYVCTADELDKVRVAIEFVGDLMRESMDKCPVRAAKEWEVMRKFSRDAALGRPVSVSVAALKNAVGH